MAEKKPVYIKCPRCELNWIKKKDRFCDVCKREMRAGSLEDETIEDDLELELCPVCKINYIADGETMCASCLEESLLEDKDESTTWKTFISKDEVEEDDEDFLPIDEEEEIDSELDTVLRKDLDSDEDFKTDDEELEEGELQAMKDALDEEELALDDLSFDDLDDDEDLDDEDSEDDEEDDNEDDED